MNKFEGHVCRNVSGICDRTGVELKSLSPGVDKFGNFKFNSGSEAEYPVGFAAASSASSQEKTSASIVRGERTSRATSLR
eukprot:9996731-Heterocapsa_arctica.AAC.1